MTSRPFKSDQVRSDAEVLAAEPSFAAKRTWSVNKWGGFAVFGLMIVVFGIAEPARFLNIDNFRTILELSAIPMLFAVALSIVVISGEFDLSFAAVAGLAAAVAAQAMAKMGVPWPVAVILAIVVGLVAGAVNGYAVAYQRIPSFVGTLAVSSVAVGLEIAMTGHQQIAQGLDVALFDLIRTKPLLGLSVPVFLAALVAITLGLVMRGTVFGRQLDAIGGNSEAAKLAGVPVGRRILGAFLLTGAISAIAGVLVVGQSASYFPDSTASQLLPGFTAVFAGLAFHPRNRFSIGGSAMGVLLVVVMTNGLVLTHQPAWATNVIQGVILLLAVRVALRRRH